MTNTNNGVKELEFSFTGQEANTILQALGELPFKASAGLIAKIREQAAPQMQNMGNTTGPVPKDPAEDEKE